MSSGSPAPSHDQPVGLFLSRDLMFTSRISSEARAQGVRVVTAGSAAQAAAMIDQWKPVVVFVDLTAGAVAAPEALVGYRVKTGTSAVYIAFGPHVEKASLEAARDAGCDLVMPRGKFHADLPELIRRYLGSNVAEQESNKT